MYTYIGCRTTKERNARGLGIRIFDVNEKWIPSTIVDSFDNPSYLITDNNKKFIYAVHGDFDKVSSYKIEGDGNLTFLNRVDSTGKNPVYMVCSRDNRFVFVATLQGGTVATLPRLADGSLGEAIYTYHLGGIVPDGVSHAHQCILDQSGKYLFVPTQGRGIGYERIWCFAIDEKAGKLELVSTVDAPEGSEPRHLVITKDNKRIYCINEKGNYVSSYDFDSDMGTLSLQQEISSLPEGYTGKGQASAIILSPDQNHLYVTNRLHDSITTYRIDTITGTLEFIDNVSTGKTPRFAMMSPVGDEIWVANEDSDIIQLFSINCDGTLSLNENSIKAESPTCILPI